MAVLKSEDTGVVSALCILNGGKQSEADGQVWQSVIVEIKSGKNCVSTAASAQKDACLLCRLPTDEIGRLLYLLKEVAQSIIEKINFEPSEPFFELAIERSPQHGVKVEAWLDAGNAETGIYTWDAIGVRFHTTEDNLARFILELEQEFAC